MCSVETNLTNSDAKPPRKLCTSILYAKSTNLEKIIHVFSWNQLKNLDIPFWNQLKILEPFEHIDLGLVKECSGP